MVEMETEGVDAWNARVDEIIGGGVVFRDEEYNRTHPLPTDEEIERIIREATE